MKKSITKRWRLDRSIAQIYRNLPYSFAALGTRASASGMARLLCDEVTTDKFHPVAFPGGSELIVQ